MVNVNGAIVSEQDAVVSVFDHGFLYGEGVYEVCRTYHARTFLLDRHLRRLHESASRIALPVPLPDAAIERRIEDTLAAAGLADPSGPDAYLRLLLTRGVGEMNYDPAGCHAPTLVIIVRKFATPPRDVYELGVRVSLVGVVRNHPASLDPIIKSNNLLNNALAMQQAIARGAFEAVMRNHRGEISECSQSNLFVVRGGTAYTPPLEAGLLAGITRQFLFEVARSAGVPIAEATLHDQDLIGADEAFLTSTTREVVPIVLVDGHRIGSGHPGPVTRVLLEAFRREAERISSYAGGAHGARGAHGA
jgi:branched-chain amino acid aminotransferase